MPENIIVHTTKCLKIAIKTRIHCERKHNKKSEISAATKVHKRNGREEKKLKYNRQNQKKAATATTTTMKQRKRGVSEFEKTHTHKIQQTRKNAHSSCVVTLACLMLIHSNEWFACMPSEIHKRSFYFQSAFFRLGLSID